MFKTIKEDVEAEIVEKKSKFIANIYYVQSIDEAENYLNSIRKKHYDAKHHCYAYSIMTEDGVVNRFSDDGEPSGTAGAPMLNILNKNNLVNIIVIVTRYFGGILLGTGGLVKAYSESTLKAIENAELVEEERGYEARTEIAYNDFEKFKFYCTNNKINIIETIYNDKIVCTLEVDKQQKEYLLNNINNFNFKLAKIEIIREKNIRKKH